MLCLLVALAYSVSFCGLIHSSGIFIKALNQHPKEERALCGLCGALSRSRMDISIRMANAIDRSQWSQASPTTNTVPNKEEAQISKQRGKADKANRHPRLS